MRWSCKHSLPALSPSLWSLCHHVPDPQTAEVRIHVGKAEAELKLCGYGTQRSGHRNSGLGMRRRHNGKAATRAKEGMLDSHIPPACPFLSSRGYTFPKHRNSLNTAQCLVLGYQGDSCFWEKRGSLERGFRTEARFVLASNNNDDNS